MCLTTYFLGSYLGLTIRFQFLLSNPIFAFGSLGIWQMSTVQKNAILNKKAKNWRQRIGETEPLNPRTKIIRVEMGKRTRAIIRNLFTWSRHASASTSPPRHKNNDQKSTFSTITIHALFHTLGVLGSKRLHHTSFRKGWQTQSDDCGGWQECRHRPQEWNQGQKVSTIFLNIVQANHGWRTWTLYRVIC